MKPSASMLGGEGGQLGDLRVEGEGRVQPAEPVPDGGRDVGVLRPEARVARPDAARPAFAHGAGDGFLDRVLEAARKRERRCPSAGLGGLQRDARHVGAGRGDDAADLPGEDAAGDAHDARQR